MFIFKKTILIDFDGTIHKYSKGWKGPLDIYDPPIDGAKEFLQKLSEEYKIVVFTTRAISKKAKNLIADWLNKYEIPFDDITAEKMPATLLIDDRSIKFENYETLETQIESFFNEGCEYCTGNKSLLEECFYNGIGVSEDTKVFIDRQHLRLVDVDDSQCFDHGEKIKINFCPMCGKGI